VRIGWRHETFDGCGAVWATRFSKQVTLVAGTWCEESEAAKEIVETDLTEIEGVK
jgi:hypothetical protein